MPDGEVLKAFRPSRLADRDELDEESQVEKGAKMVQYQMRAQAGLPLFDTLTVARPQTVREKAH